MLYYLYKIGIFIALHFPHWFSYGIARTIGAGVFIFNKRGRRAVYKNLSVILGTSDKGIIRRAAFRTFINASMHIASDIMLFGWNEKNWLDYVDLNNVDQKMRYYTSFGKGVVVPTAHLGDWEVAGFIVGFMGYKAHGIGLPQPDKRVEELYRKVREKGNVYVHPFPVGIAGVFRAIKNNEIATIVSDRDLMKDGVKVKFFGRCVTFPKGAAVLAYRSGAKSVFGCAIRMKNGKFKAYLEPEINIDRDKGEEEFIKEYVQTFASILESFIRKYPDQWFHFFDYFEEFKCE